MLIVLFNPGYSLLRKPSELESDIILRIIF